MCGLRGEVRRDGRAADVAAVTRMTATMEDRGADGTGVRSTGPTPRASLSAHRRGPDPGTSPSSLHLDTPRTSPDGDATERGSLPAPLEDRLRAAV